MEDIQEEFDSEWQKGMWDLALLTNVKNTCQYIMNGPIDYRYTMSYGIICTEMYNCSSYDYQLLNPSKKQITISSTTYSRTKTIQINRENQIYFYAKGSSHSWKSFEPHSMIIFKRNNKKNENEKKEKELYELALIMDSNRKYKKILNGPITFEKFHKNICFHEDEPYIKGDIDKLLKYGNCVKKIKANKFFSVLSENNNKYAVEFNFDDATHNKNKNKTNDDTGGGTITELWNLTEKQLWETYKCEQREEKFDIVLLTHKDKKIKFILYNVIIDCISQIMKFNCYGLYQPGDHGKLNELACKIRGFGVEKYKFLFDENDSYMRLSMDSCVEKTMYFTFPKDMQPFKGFFYQFNRNDDGCNGEKEWKMYKYKQRNVKWDVTLVLDDFENLHYFPRNYLDDQAKKKNKKQKSSGSSDGVWKDMKPLLTDGDGVDVMDDGDGDDDDEKMVLNNKEKMSFDIDSYLQSLHAKKVSKNDDYQISNLIDDNDDDDKNNDKESKEDDKKMSIWDLYVDRYGTTPQSANQLHKFTVFNKNVSHTMYKDARSVFIHRNVDNISQ